jgi:hypothetical protein
MRKRKASVLAAAGLAVLIAGTILGTPEEALAPPAVPVIVTNTPANPVPTVAQGTTAVQITNTSPLAVRDVDNPARQPFQGDATASFSGQNEANFFIPVPAGKRLVIEHVTASILVLPGRKAGFIVRTTAGASGNAVFHTMSPIPHGTFANVGYDVFIVSQPVRFYADGATQFLLHAYADGPGIGSATVSFSGYLIDN